VGEGKEAGREGDELRVSRCADVRGRFAIARPALFRARAGARAGCRARARAGFRAGESCWCSWPCRCWSSCRCSCWWHASCCRSPDMPPDNRLPHERLLAYRLALDLLERVRGLAIADARLADQVSRASKSVCLNIAEAVGRFGDADRRRVYAIARGECCEAAAAIDIALAAADCDAARGREARETAGRVYALLTGLMRRYDFETIGSKKNDQPPHEHEDDSQHEHD